MKQAASVVSTKLHGHQKILCTGSLKSVALNNLRWLKKFLHIHIGLTPFNNDPGFY
jgi:hypothetical protein